MQDRWCVRNSGRFFPDQFDTRVKARVPSIALPQTAFAPLYTDCRSSDSGTSISPMNSKLVKKNKKIYIHIKKKNKNKNSLENRLADEVKDVDEERKNENVFTRERVRPGTSFEN